MAYDRRPLGSERARALYCRAVLVLTLLSFCSPFLFARAGGGGHFSGGGGHSFGGHSGGMSFGGGGGGSSVDISYLLYWYVRLVMARPLIGVPLTILLLYAASQMYSQRDNIFIGEEKMANVIVRGGQAQDALRMRQALGELKARDPDFDAPAFLARAQAAFLKIQEAWSAQNMAAARAFISDGVMERFSIQIAMQQADKLRNKMEQIQVQNAEIVEAESDPCFDTLHVRIQASAVDTDVSLADGSLLSGSGAPETFVEIWTFLRRPGAKTLQKPGLIEGYCPSCGAPLAIADAAKCGTCQSWVNSGEYDWVLCEITQETEWAVRGSGGDVPGFKLLAEQDPALNTQFLEDRASVAFWRWQLALSEHNSGPLRCAATDDYCRQFESELQTKKSFYRDAAVGAVEVLALEPGEKLDLAHVMATWSGEWFQVIEGERVSQGHVVRQHVVVLGRKSGALTDARTGLRSARCPKCGAPPTKRDAFQCEYCGAPFNDGSHHWVATAVTPIGLWKRPALPELASAPKLDLEWAASLSTSESLAVLVSAMMADGKIDPNEEQYLRAYAQLHSVPPETVTGLIEAAASNHLQIPTPQTAEEAQACMRGLIQMSLADGRVSEEEMKVMLAYGAKIGLKEAQIAAMIKEERRALYKRAKKAIKAQPA